MTYLAPTVSDPEQPPMPAWHAPVISTMDAAFTANSLGSGTDMVISTSP